MDHTMEDIIQSVHKELRSFILARVQNESDADDILQDVYIKVYSNLHKVKDITHIKSWVFKISKNTIIDYYRTRKPASEQINDSLMDPNLENQDALNHDLECCLSDFIYLLSESDSDIINRYYYQDESHRDISENLNISDNASKMRLSRARKRLRKLIEDCCHIECDPYGNITGYTQKKKACNKFC